MHLSVVVPAYNEEKVLFNNIKKFNNYLSQCSYDYEIIIVNDGSCDRTEKIANQLVSEIKNLRFINNKKNRGKGAAVRQGLLAAKGKYRLFIDADNATSLNHVEKAWPFLEEGYGIVIGSRNPKDAPGAQQVLSQPAWKRLLGNCGNLIIQLVAVRGIWDTQCGFKIFSQEAVKNIIPKTKVNRWAIDVEILVLAQALSYKVAKIPILWMNSPDSRVGMKGYFLTLKEVLKIKWNLLKGIYSKKE